ncbi:DHHC zinc finger domain-containing protein [Cardiosporidium cionae]|uniref:DHHC zinc finger domain-containing protein n=1 Tax=Cardiosporidium cionae TaxID=476202 RepID=A0ABQ7JEE2_9APIC|nr:DHHC zinc finger domain-containing protein [Cardiosporidium cionae]|eukprot:KAF8822270.1 DHHC zinc finger domain-containing protein [Cardiosporidium cionae]
MVEFPLIGDFTWEMKSRGGDTANSAMCGSQTEPTIALSVEDGISIIRRLQLHYLFICSMANVSNELEAATVFQYIYVCLNLTTIENMDACNREHGRFDLGIKRNITQVFGTNALCWLTPCQIQSSRPAGDGVRWHMHYISASDEDVEQNLR